MTDPRREEEPVEFARPWAVAVVETLARDCSPFLADILEENNVPDLEDRGYCPEVEADYDGGVVEIRFAHTKRIVLCVEAIEDKGR